MTADRVQQAREEIRRRRALAEAATRGPWEVYQPNGYEYRPLWCIANDAFHNPLTNDGEAVDIHVDYGSEADANFIAANDPAHVLAVLDAAEQVLERHQYDDGWCSRCDVPIDDDMTGCPDAAAVLDLYAPEATA